MNNDLMNEVKDLKDEISNLKNEIKELSNIIRGNSDKMNQHIDFIEDVYSSVRHPLNFFKQKLEYLMGRKSDDLLPNTNHLK